MSFQYTPNTFVQSNFGNSGGCFSYKNFGILQVLLAIKWYEHFGSRYFPASQVGRLSRFICDKLAETAKTTLALTSQGSYLWQQFKEENLISHLGSEITETIG